jgi:hypothetical protein
MHSVFDWIQEGLERMSKKLPELVAKKPDGFECGYCLGYKDALLELEQFLFDADTD